MTSQINKKSKPTRILTIHHESGAEYIEIDKHGTIWWKAGQGEVAAGFPVDVEFVAEKFQESGRDFDVSRLPSNTIMNPYLHMMA